MCCIRCGAFKSPTPPADPAVASSNRQQASTVKIKVRRAERLNGGKLSELAKRLITQQLCEVQGSFTVKGKDWHQCFYFVWEKKSCFVDKLININPGQSVSASWLPFHWKKVFQLCHNLWGNASCAERGWNRTSLFWKTSGHVVRGS